MRSLNSKVCYVRVTVQSMNFKTMSWDFMKAEIVTNVPDRWNKLKAYDYKHDVKVEIYLYLYNWKSAEIEPLFTADFNDVSLCLDKLYFTDIEVVS